MALEFDTQHRKFTLSNRSGHLSGPCFTVLPRPAKTWSDAYGRELASATHLTSNEALLARSEADHEDAAST